MLIHSHSHDMREEAVESARAAGLMGASRLPDTVLFLHGREISDTGLVKCLDALDEGRAEREKRQAVNAYMVWLDSRREALAGEIERAIKRGCQDVSAWLKERFASETGVRL